MIDKAIIIKAPKEIDILRQANVIVAETLQMLKEKLEPGLPTIELDRMAERFCKNKGAIPAFKGYRGFPRCLCVSINEEVVHGIPSLKKKVAEGDIISIDFGVFYKGYFGDAAITVSLGVIDDVKSRLLTVTEESLYKGINQAIVGNRISDISLAIQKHVEGNGFSVVRQFVGHGIGVELHEAPEIPNYMRGGVSPRLVEGMVLAIEPMVNVGSFKVSVLSDGWTVITEDNKPSAHFEHSIAVTEKGPMILSSL